MNLTITAVSSGSGKTSQLGHAAATFVAAAGDTDLARRVRALLAELDDLRREERDVWDHVAEALSPQHA